MERLLEKLGRPEQKLPPVLHVAGTNGKGSVVATARAIAEAAGLRVHVYTSPHLVRFNERIRLAGRLIGDDDLVSLLAEVEAVNGGDPITFFEITTAAAFLAFSRLPADLLVLEVGLGGRLDATNVVARPAAVAITPVARDHEAWLGNTLPAIAAEKAGILKAGVPAVVGPQAARVEAVIRTRAEALDASLTIHGRDWRAALRSGGRGEARLVYRDRAGLLDLPAPVLVGPHQAINAGIAVALMRTQNAVAIPEAAIRAGLGWVRWPARLQRLAHGPLRDRLPPTAELWIDGAHNPAAARALRQALLRISGDLRPVHLVVGMLANRDPAAFLRPFLGIADSVTAVAIPGVEAAHPAASIAAAAGDLGINGRIAADVGSALEAIAARGGAESLVLVTGSLYLAGHVLAENGPSPD
ncbi:MAG: bifunctional folylpolyglutamate synthase/dihydrofolate synthase [Alphaproteobacteria bacterium]|nr:MAG: bifunctional folylpolyglutamate synthase/dihydrofolate synthase [Alphaproteobacteria bacterium]